MKKLRSVLMLAAGLIAIAGLRAAESSSAGRVLHVSPQGDDAAPGSRDRPWKTLTFAFAQLRAGDTLNLHGGTYFERAVLSASGTAAAPIRIQSLPGERAIVDSGFPEFREPGNNDWELVDAELGEYRSIKTYARSSYIWGYVTGVPGYENERVVLVPYFETKLLKDAAGTFRAKTDEYTDEVTPFYVGPGIFRDPADDRIHIRLAKTRALRESELRYGIVFSAEKPDPRKYGILLSGADATLTITGSHVTVANLTVNHATRSIELVGSSHVTFDNVTVWAGGNAIRTRGADVHHITVTRCRVYGDAPRWIFWSDMKNPPAPADLLRGTTIDLRDGTHDWEISYSHVRGSGQDLFSVNDSEYNVSIHHCRFENGGDDAFELEGLKDVGRIDIHDNYVRNCLMAVAPGQDTAHYTGPLYYYRNLVVCLRNPPIDRKAGINRWMGGRTYGYEYLFKQNYRVMTNAHYYHNTFVVLNSNGNGVTPIPGNPNNSTFANNIVVMVNGTVSGTYRKGEGQFVDGNLYWKVNSVDARPLLAGYDPQERIGGRRREPGAGPSPERPKTPPSTGPRRSVPGYDTVAELAAATGFETHGLGAVPKRGTDPLFAGFKLRVLDHAKETWELAPESELFPPSDFFLKAGSPAIGAAVPLRASPIGSALPDPGDRHDIGAFPTGKTPKEFDAFPFRPDAAP